MPKLGFGWDIAWRWQAYKPDGINRVILCSDGVANVGNTEAEVILSEVKGYVEEGVTMTTFGFGMDNYNDTLMEQLADNGDGFYAYVDDIDEAQRLFVDELTSTLQTIAMDAKVQVDFNPETVKRYRLVGFENRAIADDDFRDNTVDAGEIGAGHTVTALYEVKLYPEALWTGLQLSICAGKTPILARSQKYQGILMPVKSHLISVKPIHISSVQWSLLNMPRY